MPEDKINNIEEMLAHQEQQIHELNDVVTSQWKEIEALKKQLSKMQDKIGMLEENSASGPDIPANEKPPHY